MINRYRFSTKACEIQSELSYYGYRYYDGGSGKWISIDPLKEAGGLNLYAMLNNGLTFRYDFLGLKECPEGKVLDPSCIREEINEVNDGYEDAETDWSLCNLSCQSLVPACFGPQAGTAMALYLACINGCDHVKANKIRTAEERRLRDQNLCPCVDISEALQEFDENGPLPAVKDFPRGTMF